MTQHFTSQRLAATLATVALMSVLTACGGSNNSPAPAPAPAQPPASPPASGTPVSTVAHAGNNQSATVGTAVSTQPAVRILDNAGKGVPGMTVTFSVIAGGGTITGATPVSDGNGVATLGSWTLGAAPGTNTLSARTQGLPEVTFNATATAAAGQTTLTKVAASDNQSAQVGTAVPNAPQVIVRNGAGQPMQGVTVNFTPASGSGSVQNSTSVSGSDGTASAGTWTLGPSAGTHTLNASASGVATVTFSATALAAGTPTISRTVFMSGLQTPWDMVFAPDGTVFYTERNRGMSVMLTNGTRRLLFNPSDFVAQDQSGMLGVALDPNFASNRTVFVFMGSNAGGSTDNRIVRFTVNADYTAVSNRTDIVTGIAYAGGAHSGGRIRFGGDGYLYITTGDNRTGTVPQSPTVLGGKVLRVDRDGNAAPGNNAPQGFDARIYTYGHRNPQGIAFRIGGSNAGTAYSCEHGPGDNDEVTPLSAGGNGGWDPRPRGNPPRCPNGTDMSYCGYQGSKMTDTTVYPNAMPPAWSTGSSSQGMSGCAFLSGTAWRDWNGALAVALLAGRRIEILRLNAAGSSATNTPILNTLNIRLRTAVLGPDGALYVLTNDKPGGDEVWKISPG